VLAGLCAPHLDLTTEKETDKHVNDCIDASASEQCKSEPDTEAATPAFQSTEKPRSTISNLFNVLMSGHKETQAWREAASVENKSFRPTKANGGRRKAPFYKVTNIFAAFLHTDWVYRADYAGHANRGGCFSIWQDPWRYSLSLEPCAL
jgi:hypothetical protein